MECLRTVSAVLRSKGRAVQAPKKQASLRRPVRWRHIPKREGLAQVQSIKGGKGLALDAGTVVRALFITIDKKV